MICNHGVIRSNRIAGTNNFKNLYRFAQAGRSVNVYDYAYDYQYSDPVLHRLARSATIAGRSRLATHGRNGPRAILPTIRAANLLAACEGSWVCYDATFHG